jgi:hypothetical protein
MLPLRIKYEEEQTFASIFRSDPRWGQTLSNNPKLSKVFSLPRTYIKEKKCIIQML